MTPAKFREKGREYDGRVRLMPEQRDLKQSFNQVYVPNVNRKLVRLADVANGDMASGLPRLNVKIVVVTSKSQRGLAPGAGLSDVVNDAVKAMSPGDSSIPCQRSLHIRW